MSQDQEMVEAILALFRELSAIPRKSGHEKAASRYLYEKLAAMGLDVARDARGNVIAEKPAAPGCAHWPRVILQAHMDMVCVAAEGVVYDPLTDPIRLRVADGCLSAEGTSLGADDGIDVVAILYLMRERFPHGPLRAIFTVDEEDGMSGAIHLDEKYLAAAYLINCDSEDVELLTAGSAGSVALDFVRAPRWEAAPPQGKALTVTAADFAGGHSGVDIHRGRANAVRVLALLLDRLAASGAAFALADFQGGAARNAIPARAAATIVVGEAAEPLVARAAAEMRAYLRNVYGAAEERASITVASAEPPSRVLAADCGRDLLRLLLLLHTGVYALDPRSGQTAASANLGVVRVTEEQIAVQFFPRSAADEWLEEVQRAGGHLAAACGFTLQAAAPSAAWPTDGGGRLTAAVQESFLRLAGRPIRTESVHAGLECSWFYRKNPRLEMVSIGPTIMDIHSPRERLQLNTLALHVRVVQDVLQNLR